MIFDPLYLLTYPVAMKSPKGECNEENYFKKYGAIYNN